MKRQNLTMIIGKVQVLTYRVHHFGLPNSYNQRICKAAVNEILRLQDSTPELGLGANTPGAAPDLMNTILNIVRPKP